jgi:hypothetical protein
MVGLMVAAVLLTTGFRLVQGGDTALGSGETYEGTMLFTGGNYTVEEGAAIDGDVWMIGGNVVLHGEITGDVHLYGGNIAIMPGGSIDGELIDQRRESSGGDGFDVVDVGPLPCACCCGLPLALLLLVVLLLVRAARKSKTPMPAAGEPPQGLPPTES